MKKIKLLFLLLLISNSLFSQDLEAELFFNNGDILEGYGMITKNDKIKFRISLEDEPEKWTSLMVKKIIFYGFETSKTFEYIKLNENQKPILLELVSKGKMNLYELNESYYVINPNMQNNAMYSGSYKTNSKTLYVKREDEKVATSLGLGFRMNAKKYFKDCDLILEMIETREFKKYTNKEIIDIYNIYCYD